MCLLTLVTGEEPSWRFRDKQAEKDDQTREKHLQPDGEDPRVVTLDVKSATSDTRRQDSTGKPGGVAKTSDNTTVLGMSGLDDPDRSCSSRDRYAESNEETAAHHLADGCVGGCEALNDGTDNDEHAANEHANATSPTVDSGADKGESRNTTDLMHRTDDTSPDTFVLSVEMLQEVLLVVQETTQEHTIVAVHGLAEEADQEDGKQLQAAGRVPGNWLPEESLIVGSATLDFLDFDELDRTVSIAILISGRAVSDIFGSVDGVCSINDLGSAAAGDLFVCRHVGWLRMWDDAESWKVSECGRGVD